MRCLFYDFEAERVEPLIHQSVHTDTDALFALKTLVSRTKQQTGSVCVCVHAHVE